MARAVSAVLGVALWLLSIQFVVRLATLLQRHYSPGPFSDYWWVIASLKKWNGAAPLSWFWERTVDHRHVIPKIALWLDWNLFAGVGLSVVWLSFALQVASVVVLGLVLRRLGIGGYDRWACVGLLTFVSFHYLQQDNLFLPYQICFYFPLLFAVAGFGALAVGVEGRRGLWVRVAVAASLLAGLSMANGVLLWIPLALAALLLGYERKYLAAIAGMGIAFAAVYFTGFFDQGGSAPKFSVSRIWEYAVFFVTLVARPWYYLNDQLAARAAQVTLVLIGGLSIAVVARKELRKPLNVFALGMCWFLLLTIALTTYGRLDSGFVERYYTPSLAFWAYAVIAVMAMLPRSEVLVAVRSVALIVILVTIFDDYDMRQKIIAKQQRMDLGSAALTAKVNDQVATFWLGAYGFIVPENLPHLFEKNKSFRAMRPFSLVGHPLPRVTKSRTCDHLWRLVRPIPGGQYAGFQAETSHLSPGDYILFEDAQEVVGLAVPDPDRGAGIGYLKPRSGNSKVWARLVDYEGESCRLPQTFENWPDPNQLPDVESTEGWQLVWKAGDPYNRVLGADAQVRDGALEMTATASFSQVMVDLPEAMSQYDSVIVRLRSEFADYLMLLGLPNEPFRGAIPFENRWMIAKMHLSRRRDWRTIPNKTAQFAIGPLYSRHKAISHVWVSKEPAPDRDLDVQFFSDLPQLARR